MKIIFTILTFMLFSTLKAQVAITYYPFQSVLSISSNTEKPLFLDYRIETNTFISNLNMELAPVVNLKMTEVVNYYMGAGINFNAANVQQDLPLENGYFLMVGSRIKPLSTNRNIQLVFEISPYINREFSGGNFRTRLGLAYNFNRG